MFVRTLKVGAQWVVAQKGTPSALLVKARQVIREFAVGDKRDDLFAGTPEHSMLGYAVSQAATGHAARGQVLVVLDIKSAFLYGETKRAIVFLISPTKIGMEKLRVGRYTAQGALLHSRCPHSSGRITSPPH